MAKFKITVQKKGKIKMKHCNLKKEKETIDKIYQMAQEIENEIYAEQIKLDDIKSYQFDRV